jgi:hypothetical protein
MDEKTNYNIGKVQKVGNDGRSIYIPKEVANSPEFQRMFSENEPVFVQINANNTMTIIPAEVKPKRIVKD